jgi:hypothetical protein
MNFRLGIPARQIMHIEIPDGSNATVGVNRQKKSVSVKGSGTLGQLGSWAGRIGVDSERTAIQLIHDVSRVLRMCTALPLPDD